MTTTVQSWHGKITHITDDNIGSKVRTRCGRTLKTFHSHHAGAEFCDKCGSEEDFDAIYEARRLEEEKAKSDRQEEKKKREALYKSRLERHCQIMSEFGSYLETIDASCIDHKKRPAGGEISFVVDGLKFKLSGSIHV